MTGACCGVNTFQSQEIKGPSFWQQLAYLNMADEDIATRAPESDLAEQSIIPGDSVVDQGARMGMGVSCSRPIGFTG